MLPAFLLIIYDSLRASDKTYSQLNAASLKKSSATALPVMLLIIATGLIVADYMVTTYYHALVASSYGWLLNFKLAVLALILFIAYQARNRWLPLFSQFENTEQVRTDTEYLRKWVGIEFILALLLVLLATMLANTLPAKHALIENWPYPFRFSINATWEEPNVQELVWTDWSSAVAHCATDPLAREEKELELEEKHPGTRCADDHCFSHRATIT